MKHITLTLCTLSLLMLSFGCSGSQASKPVNLRTSTQCATIAQKHDPMVMFKAWEVAPQKLAKRHGDAAVVALMGTWPTTHAVRLWSLEDGTWFGVVAPTPEPDPNADVVVVSWSSDAAHHPLVRAQVRKASDLWPTH